MSIPYLEPIFDELTGVRSQTHLFGLQARSSEVFSETDRYRLFAQKIYPLLVEARPGVEPVVLLGVSVLQFLERVPDRQAVDLVKYPIGWKPALAQELDGEVFDPTVLVRFRERLIEHEQGRLAFELVLGVFGRMATLECVLESLRPALEELAEAVSEGPRES